ncbi:MAG: nucleotidyltransferase domain-containing protein, partial [Deltaproteobacteria bacterium]|nr:nucleotidyltransferase domain-containing protein [Deltaproteobacteria bacterium]
ETEENAADWFRELPTDAEFELKKIEMRSALDQSRGIPKLRVAWEKQEKENALVEKYANKIAAMLVEGLLTTKDTCNFLKSKSDKLTCLAIVNGVRKAIEMIAKDNLKKAREIFLAHEDDVQSLWLKDLPEMRDTITSMFSRLTNLGVIERVCLEKLGIHLPKLDSMVSNSKDLIVTEIQDLAPIINSMATNTDISKLIYPVAILFGSRLKGYAKRNADLDVAVFIKPDVPRNKRPEIQRILSRVFSNKKIDGKIVEFWLTEENSKLQIIDFTDADVSLADSTWIHLLFASVWFGKDDAIRELYTKLLPGFIYSTGKKFEDYDARDLWLDEMEREVLQYRLMHKGYKRLFPEEGGIRTEHAKGMDPQSSFWDSGYRRLATKLFITRVFLPQLKEPKQK